MDKTKMSDQRAAGSSAEPKKPRKQSARKPPPKLDDFWPAALSDVEKIRQVDVKNQSLPLARIKKIMKLDENAKMIAAEAPLLFAKACEYFIQELTLRAWVHTEENKRRTLQRSDIATAISIYDQFDFLIDIVPREDIKPSPQTTKKDTESKMQSTGTANTQNTSTDQFQYLFQLGQQQQQPQNQQQQQHQQNQNQNTFQQTTSGGIVNQSMAMNTTTAGMNIITPQNIMQPIQQPIQLIQQIVTPTGDIQNVPITISQNQLLRMQMQGVTGNNLQTQQLMIPTLQQQPHLLQIGSAGTIQTTSSGINSNQNATTSSGMFINASQGNSIVSTDKNLGSTYRPN